MTRRRGFTLIEMLVTLVIASIVFAMVAVIARDLAKAEERMRVAMLGGDSLRAAAARLETELENAPLGGVSVESESEIRVSRRGGGRVRLTLAKNALVRTSEDVPENDPSRKRSWAMNGTLSVLDHTSKTITFRFTPELGSKTEVFVVACSAPDADEP
jgi:prepilin-type N-terminal cleavage/methylation domain-containing protein